MAAEESTLTVGGKAVPGYTVNGTSPGPTLTAVQGQLIEVHLTNASVTDGVTLHWHGIDVPNAEDGVAGVTQDAVAVGGEFTYRFVAEQAGTYWYHSHQVSDEQVHRRAVRRRWWSSPRTPVPQAVDVIATGPHLRRDPDPQRRGRGSPGRRRAGRAPCGSG